MRRRLLHSWRALRQRLARNLPGAAAGLGLSAAALMAWALHQRVAPDAAGRAGDSWLVFGLGGLAALLLAALLAEQRNARHRAEGEARRLGADVERLALVARKTFDAVLITDTSRRITWVNAGFERITGWQLHEVLGRSPGELLQTPETDRATVAKLRAALDNCETFVGELLNRHRDGTLYWVEVEIQPLRDAGGAVTGFMAVERDITAARQAQIDVQRSAQVLRSAIDAIDEAFVLFDADDRLVLCNQKYRDVYKMSAEIIVPGVAFEDILRHGLRHGQYPAAAGCKDTWLAERISQHKRGNATIVQRLEDGRTLRVLDRRTPDGYLVGFRVDITELVRATEAAQQADLAKSEFIATISHELRTPLQSVLGFSELGQHFAADRPQFQAMFDDILSGGRRMLTLVNALLDVSKIDATGSTLVKVPGDLAALAGAVVHELRPQLAARSLSVRLPATPTAPPALMNAFRMQQVLRNLLANAIRFAPEGSSIEIDSGIDAHADIWLSVRDHGPGIPPDEIDAVFEAFVQSSRTRDGAGGTGLGLTICRKIVLAHGGRITAAHAEGGGALLRLVLPAAPVATASSASVAPPASPAASDLHRSLAPEALCHTPF